jgi:adenylate kinase
MLADGGEVVNSCIELHVPDEVLEERVCGRWIHKASGRSYHTKFNPPKSFTSGTPSAENMKDDQTGEALYQRNDDTAEALVKRLASYHGKTEPILDHYRPTGIVRKINANAGMPQVWADLEQRLDETLS